MKTIELVGGYHDGLKASVPEVRQKLRVPATGPIPQSFAQAQYPVDTRVAEYIYDGVMEGGEHRFLIDWLARNAHHR